MDGDLGHEINCIIFARDNIYSLMEVRISQIRTLGDHFSVGMIM